MEAAFFIWRLSAEESGRKKGKVSPGILVNGNIQPGRTFHSDALWSPQKGQDRADRNAKAYEYFMRSRGGNTLPL